MHKTFSQPPRPGVNFVVALPAEAKPIANHFGLRRQMPDEIFPLYRRGEISLVISGPGKVAAATATSWLFEHIGGQRNALWLNVGIAGHRDRPVGEALLAHRILDRASGRSWPVPLAVEPPLHRVPVITVDSPVTHYKAGHAFDMEAAGFFAAALPLSYPGRVQCIKVVSDNAANPLCGINGKRVRQWVSAHQAMLSVFVETLRTDSRFFAGSATWRDAI